MFEIIGLLFGLFVAACLCVLLGYGAAACAWLFLRGRDYPKKLILAIARFPLSSLAYVVACGIIFEIFVPNQPDVFFGDFSEPLPNGYVLHGLGKMPEYSFIESTEPRPGQSSLPGDVRSLEQNADEIYGAYRHPNNEVTQKDKTSGYFAFDTRTGIVQAVASLSELNARAGHQVHLVDSQNFKSTDPVRARLRKMERRIYWGPPMAVFLVCLCLLLYYRITGKPAPPQMIAASK